MPMQKIGLIQREINTKGAHASLVRITKAGKNTGANAAVTIESVAEELTESLCPEQLKSFTKLFEGLN